MNDQKMSGAALTNGGEAGDPDATISFLDTCRKPRGGIVNTSLNSSTHASSYAVDRHGNLRPTTRRAYACLGSLQLRYWRN